MKIYRAGVLALAVAALAACSWPFGASTEKAETTETDNSPKVEIYYGDELQATYTLDDEGIITKSVSKGSFDVLTTREYDYTSDGDIASITETYDGSPYSTKTIYSTSRSLGRSGNLASKTISTSKSSTVPNRAMVAENYVMTYNYDDEDNLEAIVAEDENGNIEAKVFISDSKESYDEKLGLSLADISTSTDTTSRSLDGESLTGLYAEIKGTVHDFRPLGASETRSSNGDDTTVAVNALTEGMLFIDEGGVARKVTSVGSAGNIIVYTTTRPDFTDFLSNYYVPAYTYDWSDLEARPEYTPNTTITVNEDNEETRNTVSYGYPAINGNTLSYYQYWVGSNKGDLTINLTPTVSMGFDFAYSTNTYNWYGTVKKYGGGRAILTADLGLDASVEFNFESGIDKKLPIYVAELKYGSTVIEGGVYAIPSISGEIHLEASAQYEMKRALGVTWTNNYWSFPSSFSKVNTAYSVDTEPVFTFSGAAEVTAQAKFLALGVSVEAYGWALFESFPGVGVYAKIGGSVDATYKKTTFYATTSTKTVDPDPALVKMYKTLVTNYSTTYAKVAKLGSSFFSSMSKVTLINSYNAAVKVLAEEEDIDTSDLSTDTYGMYIPTPLEPKSTTVTVGGDSYEKMAVTGTATGYGEWGLFAEGSADVIEGYWSYDFFEWENPFHTWSGTWSFSSN